MAVYQKSVDFADKAIFVCDEVQDRAYAPLKDQLRRAALSVPLNIAESNGRTHYREKKQFYFISRGSLHECIPIIEILLRRKKIGPDVFRSLYDQAEEIARMLAGLIDSLEER
ncbi:MAG: four helix bundle protein [Candidatus Margulisiibacteriota bacterium]